VLVAGSLRRLDTYRSDFQHQKLRPDSVRPVWPLTTDATNPRFYCALAASWPRLIAYWLTLMGSVCFSEQGALNCAFAATK